MNLRQLLPFQGGKWDFAEIMERKMGMPVWSALFSLSVLLLQRG